MLESIVVGRMKTCALTELVILFISLEIVNVYSPPALISANVMGLYG